jgi:hypothetical protein
MPGVLAESVPCQVAVLGSSTVVFQPQPMPCCVSAPATASFLVAAPDQVVVPTSILVALGFSVPLGSAGLASTHPTTRL